MPTPEELQDQTWARLYSQLVAYFERQGTEDAFGRGDFWVVDDNYSWPSNMIYFFNLDLMTVTNILHLQSLLADCPGWSIYLVVDVVGKETEWPPMGVTVRRHEIIDGLLRKYLPEKFRFLKIPGSRPGTGYD
jgi:hypothetical protein